LEWPRGEKEPTKYWLSTLSEDIGFHQLVDYAAATIQQDAMPSTPLALLLPISALPTSSVDSGRAPR